MAQLALIDGALERGSGKTCEDRFGFYGRLAYVVDGASEADEVSPLSSVSEGAWAAEQVGARLASLGTAGFSGGARSVIRDLAGTMHRELDRLNWPQDRLPPACSLGLVVLDDDRVEMATLGDVSVIRVTDNSVERLFDERFLQNEMAAVSEVTAEPASQQTRAIRARGAAGIIERRRRYLYDSEGPAILGDSPEAAGRALTRVVEVRDGDIYAIASDGFMRLVDAFGILTVDELAAALLRGEAARLVVELRAHEADTAATAPQFFKPTDDVAVLVLGVING